MFKRSIFTLKKIFKHHKELSNLNDSNYLESVTKLTPELLFNQGINYLALDFDGVLASHGKPEIYPQVKEWLDIFAKEFGEQNIFILSNKPTVERLEYFKKNYPKIRFISNVAKKPYPDGLLKIKEIVKCKSREIALVDDRLLTGCLACIISNSYPLLILNPHVDKNNYTIEERFFSFLRFWERKFFL